MNEGFGKDFKRKGNSMQRSGTFIEPPDSENRNVAVLIPFPKIRSERTTILKACGYGRWLVPGAPAIAKAILAHHVYRYAEVRPSLALACLSGCKDI